VKSPVYFAKRFVQVARSRGLSGAFHATVWKVGQWLQRPPSAATVRIEAATARAMETAERAQAQIAEIAAANPAARLAELEAAEQSLRVRQAEFDARAARLEAFGERVDQAWQALEAHGRSLVSLAELQAASASTPALPAAEAILISVIMPTRNRAELLRRAIRSVQEQSWTGWELVVVDDGSTDSTAAVLSEAAQRDPRVRWFGQSHQGHAVARNVGLGEARGDVITYLDDDNEYYRDYLGTVAAAFVADHDLEMTYAGQVWVGSTLATLVTFDRYSWDDLRLMSVSIDTNVVAHRRSLFERLGGYDAALLRHADLDLVLRYSAVATPQRLPVMAVRYSWDATGRVTNTMSSAAALHRIGEKYAQPIGAGLRVLVLAYDYPQLSESYIHAEIRWMLSRGVEIEVFSMEEPTSRGEPLVPVHRADLDQVVAEFKPDVIHLHFLSLARHYAAELSRLGVPVTVRGHGFDHSEELLDALLAEPWMAHVYLFSNLVHPGTSHRAKLRSADCAFDTSRYFPVLAKDRHLVLRAGACLPSKDLDLFIEVAALRPEYRFVLVLSTNASGVETDRRLRERNAALGNPVEILVDLQYEPMAELMRCAGIYLHTFGFVQPFGQPISVAEAMASGAIPLLRRADATVSYAGEAGLYYETAEEASQILADMLSWDEARWEAARLTAIDLAYRRHADTRVLEPILRDWLALATGGPGEP
jgi:glycosyltransferase involved in cell wall biosynthesis